MRMRYQTFQGGISAKATPYETTVWPLHRYQDFPPGSNPPPLPAGIEYRAFVERYPPLFLEDEQGHYHLVANELSLRIINALKLSKYTAGTGTRTEFTSEVLTAFVELDRQFYACLKTPPVRSSRTWRINRLHVLAGQICPLCQLKDPSKEQPLSGPGVEFWRSNDDSFPLKCRRKRCGFYIILPKAYVHQFMNYSLPTRKYLAPTGEDNLLVRCPDCRTAGRQGDLFTLHLRDTSTRVCSNGLRKKPTCHLVPPDLS